MADIPLLTYHLAVGSDRGTSVTHVGHMSLDHEVWVESRLLHALITVGSCLNVSRRGSWRGAARGRLRERE